MSLQTIEKDLVRKPHVDLVSFALFVFLERPFIKFTGILIN